MMSRILSPLLLVIAAGCSAVPKGYKLSEFYFNGKKDNTRIESRIPDYGDGHPDGCMVMGEMSLAVNYSAAGFFEGVVTDVNSQITIPGANVTISAGNDTTQLTFWTDSSGVFKLNKRTSVDYIGISCIGYRNLKVKLAGKKLFK